MRTINLRHLKHPPALLRCKQMNRHWMVMHISQPPNTHRSMILINRRNHLRRILPHLHPLTRNTNLDAHDRDPIHARILIRILAPALAPVPVRAHPSRHLKVIVDAHALIINPAIEGVKSKRRRMCMNEGGGSPSDVHVDVIETERAAAVVAAARVEVVVTAIVDIEHRNSIVAATVLVRAPILPAEVEVEVCIDRTRKLLRQSLRLVPSMLQYHPIHHRSCPASGMD